MKIKIKDVTKKVLPLVIIPFILTGCGQKSDCEIPSRHVHKFVSNNGIVKYIDSEQKQYGNYNWQKDYLEITNDDALFFKTKGNLFEGDDNWKYLYNVMKFTRFRSAWNCPRRTSPIHRQPRYNTRPCPWDPSCCRSTGKRLRRRHGPPWPYPSLHACARSSRCLHHRSR